jgi:G:T-mismatch repair DNA endonuclease (very short patch repair protein)
MFPDCLMHTPKDRYNISKNSGKFMKEDKWRKWASNRIKGENNPNHKSKTTEQQRKEISPFSEEFYKKRGLTEDDRKKFIKKATENINYNTRVEFYIKQGYSEEKAIEELKERQATGRLDKFIKRYGDIEGRKRWKEKQEKWKSKVFNEKTCISRGESILSNDIIDDIVLENKNNDSLLFGKEEKFIYDKEFKRAYKYDLTNENNKRIIEINGIYWHCKPCLYEPIYVHKVKKMTAQEIWDYDKRKIQLANEKGFIVLTIWEDEIYENPNDVINRCINFIYEKNI